MMWIFRKRRQYFDLCKGGDAFFGGHVFHVNLFEGDDGAPVLR